MMISVNISSTFYFSGLPEPLDRHIDAALRQLITSPESTNPKGPDGKVSHLLLLTYITSPRCICTVYLLGVELSSKLNFEQ